MNKPSTREQLHSLIRDTKDYLEENPSPYFFFEIDLASHFPKVIAPPAKPKVSPPIDFRPQKVPEKNETQTAPLVAQKPLTATPEQPKTEKPPKVDAPVEKKPQKISLKPKRTELQSSARLSQDFFVYLEKLMPGLLPEIPLSSTKPDDTIARKIAHRWQYEMQAAEISILSSTKNAEEKAFLANLAEAISITFAPCRVIDSVRLEQAEEWSSFLSASQLQLILANDHEIWRLKNLMTHYKENPSQRKAFLGKIPLFMLPDLSLYFKDPQLKRSLWKALCQKMKNLDL